jgi:hypothetical protein
MGWVIEVQGPSEPRPQLYVTLADSRENAEALVGDHIPVTNHRVTFHKVITDGEVARLGLKQGEVRLYA